MRRQLVQTWRLRYILIAVDTSLRADKKRDFQSILHFDTHLDIKYFAILFLQRILEIMSVDDGNAQNEVIVSDFRPPKVIKFLLVGDSYVGKTSLLRQYCDNVFMTSSIETLGGFPAHFSLLFIWTLVDESYFLLPVE